MKDNPAIHMLRNLRRSLAPGRLTPADRRTVEENVWMVIFGALEELLRFLDEFQRRVETGERCRVVEREHVRADGRMVVEFVIEVMP